MTRSIPHRLQRCSCGRGVLVRGSRTHSLSAPGRSGARLAEPTAPGPWPRTRSFADALPGVRFSSRGRFVIVPLERKPTGLRLLTHRSVGQTVPPEKQNAMVSGNSRALGNKTSTPYAAGAAMEGAELLREFARNR
jgi:hypothetical protein